MSVAFVQKSTLVGSSSFTSSRQSNALSSNPTVGNYLIAWYFGNGLSGDTATAPTFTDTGSNTWVVPSSVYQRNTSQVFFVMSYAKVATSGSNFKVTGTMPAGITSKGSIFIAEFSGIASSSPVDGTPVGAIANSSTASFSLGNMTVSSGSLTVAGCCNSDGNTNVTMTTSTGFTLVLAQTDTSSVIGIGQGIYGIGLTSPTNPSWSDANLGTWAGSQFALKVAGGTLFTRTASDTPSTSESTTRIFTGIRGFADSPSTSDSPSRVLGLHRSFLDSPLTTDQVNRLLNLFRNSNDSPSSIDTLTRLLNLQRGNSDSPTTTDSLNRVVNLQHTIDDSPSTTESLARVLTLHLSTVDSPTTIDIVNRALNIQRTNNDIPLTTDSLTSSLVLNKATSDSPSSNDLIERVITETRTINDTPLSSESIGIISTLIRSISDSSITTDTINQTNGKIIVAIDSPISTDTVNRILDLHSNLVDSPSTLDSTAAVFSFSISSHDSPSTSDSISSSKVLHSLLSDNPNTSDNVSRTVQNFRIVIDTPITTENLVAVTISPRIGIALAISSTIYATFLLSTSTNQNFTISVTTIQDFDVSVTTIQDFNVSTTISQSFSVSQAMIVSNLSCPFGQKRIWTATYTPPPTSNVSAANYVFTIRDSTGDILLQLSSANGNIIVTDGVNGVLTITASATNTQITPGSYLWDLWRVDLGFEDQVGSGKFTVTPSYRLWGE